MRSWRRRFNSTPASLVAATLLATAAVAQTTPAARDIVKNSKPLTSAELVVVLTAARQALSGKIFRFAYSPAGPGPLVLIGSDGRPRLMRAESGYDFGRGGVSSSSNGQTVRTEQSGHLDLISFTHYTREPAKTCDGKDLGDELVVEYEHKSTDGRWTARARARTASELLAPVFDMLTGVIPLESGAIARVGDHTARALVGPWKPPPGAIPGSPLQAQMRQSLWIDTTSLLPVRWSIAIPANPATGVPAIPDYGVWFTYDAASELRPPDGVDAPTCVR
jgi:hypothetical protein